LEILSIAAQTTMQQAYANEAINDSATILQTQKYRHFLGWSMSHLQVLSQNIAIFSKFGLMALSLCQHCMARKIGTRTHRSGQDRPVSVVIRWINRPGGRPADLPD